MEQKLEKMRHPFLNIDLSPTSVRFDGLRSKLWMKASFEFTTYTFFQIFIPAIIHPTGKYFSDACIPHQKTIQGYTLYMG